jgi:hypothetical protein
MQKLTSLSPTWQYLEALFPRQANVPVLDAGKTIGFAEQTIRNRLHNDNFPIRTFMLGRRRMVLKADLVEYLDARTMQKKKRRGPRTKAERIEALAQIDGGTNG